MGRRLNQADLARALNRSPEWVHELEYGRVPHYPELPLDVALALGLKDVPEEMLRAYDETVASTAAQGKPHEAQNKFDRPLRIE